MAEQSFHHYSLKHRAIAWISQNLFRANVYTVGHGLNFDRSDSCAVELVPAGEVERRNRVRNVGSGLGLNLIDGQPVVRALSASRLH